MPRRLPDEVRYFVQITNGPNDLVSCHQGLTQVADDLQVFASDRLYQFGQPLISVFDATRDLQGFFYAIGNWREKHKLLKERLEEKLGIELTNNGNSFNTCFQFVEK